MKDIQKKIYYWRVRKIVSYLKKTNARQYTKHIEKYVISGLRKFHQQSPAYKDLTKHVDIKTVQTLADFQKKVPIVNKGNFYDIYSSDEILGNRKNELKLTMTSSGYSGNFAYGFISDESLKKARFGSDITLEYLFNISQKKTFVINCSPMGVHIETSLPIAETSVRSDMVIALLKKVSPMYEQTVLGGDPYFVKKVIEDAAAEGIDFNQLKVSLVTGQDWLPETLRTYLGELIGIDTGADSERGIYTTMGMTELGLNVFHETPFTVKLRRFLAKDKKLLKDLTGENLKNPPCIFIYYPFRTYIENIQTGKGSELVFSSLAKDALLPLMRYATGDSGIVKTYSETSRFLKGHSIDLTPDLQLPLGILFGRTSHLENNNIPPMELIKEAAFSDFQLASSITGLIHTDIDNNVPLIHLHLKENITATDKLQQHASKIIGDFIHSEIQVVLHNYADMKGAMDLNYERKLRI